MMNSNLLFVPLVTLIQGIIYLGLSIWGLVMRECSRITTDISYKTFQYTTDIIYLQDQSCGEPNITLFGVEEPITLKTDWIDAEPIKLRTFIFLILYCVFSAQLILTSIWAISSINGSVFKNLAFRMWITAVLAQSLLDAVATGFHIYDIINTTSAHTTFKYLGIKTDPHTMRYIKQYDVEFTTPAIVMCCLSSRVVVLWLFNIFGSGYCLSVLNKSPAQHIVVTNTIITTKQQK